MYEVEVKEVAGKEIECLSTIKTVTALMTNGDHMVEMKMNIFPWCTDRRRQLYRVIRKALMIDTNFSLVNCLYKWKLYSPKKEDCSIRIEIDAQEDLYDNVLGCLLTTNVNESK